MTGRPGELVAKVGKEFLIELPSNRTTGYRWNAEYDPAILQLTTIDYRRSSTKPGAGGTESFRFKPLRPGKTMIRMRYSRGWEQRPVRETTYDLEIDPETSE
jgi:predicted secreted protein